MSLSIGDFEYKVENEVKKAFEKTINAVSAVANLKRINLTKDDYDDIVLIMEVLIDDKCTFSCTRPALDSYFGDKSRFESDAPYSTFDQLSQSPLLNQFWASYFRPMINAVKNREKNATVQCEENCRQYLRIKSRAENLVERWFSKMNVSTLLIPTVSTTEYANDVSKNPFSSLIPVLTLAGLASLNVPVGFSSDNQLPIGMSLWARISRCAQ